MAKSCFWLSKFIVPLSSASHGICILLLQNIHLKKKGFLIKIQQVRKNKLHRRENKGKPMEEANSSQEFIYLFFFF